MRPIHIVGLLGCLLVPSTASAAEYWHESFDSLATEWSCGMSPCATACPSTPAADESYTSANQDCENWPNDGQDHGNVQVTTEANNPSFCSGPGCRGLRLNLVDKAFPDNEQGLTGAAFGTALSLFHLRWFMRESTVDFEGTSYQKLFRLKHNGSQRIIPEWRSRAGHTRFEIAIHPFNGELFGWDYNHEQSGRAGQWVCYEIMVDFVGQRAELWIDEVSQGEQTSADLDTSWRLTDFMTGGNNHTSPFGWAPDATHTRDYDEVVVADAYIGCTGLLQPECSDGADNDGDGAVDFPDDTGCASAADDDESDCGDGACEDLEDCDSCEADCGSCGIEDAGTEADAQTDDAGDPSSAPGPTDVDETDAGCGCRTPTGAKPVGSWLVLLWGVAVLRRRQSFSGPRSGCSTGDDAGAVEH